jgi:bifunctional non-homologous end joining protein LigD
MLATAGPLPVGPGWAYELKWDGVRALAEVGLAGLRLHARSGALVTAGYPELHGLAAALPLHTLLDGEIVLLDAAGRPSFTALTQRMHVREPVQAAKLAAAQPVTYVIFDILRLAGRDLTGLSYTQRRNQLEQLDLGARHWLVAPSFEDGPATLAAAREHALEGVVAKRLSSLYRIGQRTPDWIKVKLEQTEDFVIGGWRPGVRELGALLVGLPIPGGLTYRGRVGGGISAAVQQRLLAELARLRVPDCPFVEPPPREDQKDAVWVRPELVVEVRFGQLTPDGRLRFPRFVRLRPDKTPAQCDHG